MPPRVSPAFVNSIGGQHTFVEFKEKGGQSWGWGYGGTTAEEKAFRANSSTPCKRARSLLKYGPGAGKSGVKATDQQIKECISLGPSN